MHFLYLRRIRFIDNNTLNNITLIIFSHNRQHCLIKTLQFYSETNLNIIVLDNSPTALNSDLIPLNTKYLHSQLSFSERSIKAAELISTPYTIIGADDEVYLPSALVQMQAFLNENEDYVSVGGATLAIWKYGKKVSGIWAYKKTYGYHNNEKSSLARIALHTGQGRDPITSFFTCNLTRSKVMQECLRIYGLSPIVCTDAISVLIVCGSGASKYLNLLYWIRNWNQSPRSHPGWNRNINLYDWWYQKENIYARLKFEKKLSEVYSLIDAKENFSDAWQYCMQAEKKLRKRQTFISRYLQVINELQQVKNIKYVFKYLFSSAKISNEVSHTFQEFEVSNVKVRQEEALKAIEIIKDLLPYKNW